MKDPRENTEPVADWEDAPPGFVEADFVAHCGNHADGPFLHTLVLTDVATWWTECLSLLHRSEADVIEGLCLFTEFCSLSFPVIHWRCRLSATIDARSLDHLE